jgi:adenylate cyclase
MENRENLDQRESPIWKAIFSGDDKILEGLRREHSRWPGQPRCILCAVPFGGTGGAYWYRRGVRKNSRNPRYCNDCDKHIRNNLGGATVELSMLIIDIRNWVSLTEKMEAHEVHKEFDPFYKTTTNAIMESEGLVHELKGDGIFGVYPPGFCGSEHASKAMLAASMLLSEPPWCTNSGAPMQIGIAVHTGSVYVCKLIGANDRIRDVAMLGSDTNLAWRLSQVAGPKEALVSHRAGAAARLDISDKEWRTLELKGISEPFRALVLKELDGT